MVSAFNVSCFCQQVVSLHSLLQQMTNFSSEAKWQNPSYTMKQASSYDRRSVSPDKPGWFANGDFNQYIRTEQKGGHTEFVMMDAAGPGAIVRFWLTALFKDGKLRFYFNNEEKPAIEIDAYDLMKLSFDPGRALLNPHSSYDPKGKGGNTLYLPLPYQNHCKVTFEQTDTGKLKSPHYYQINYRTYESGTKVKTFTMSDVAAEKDLIKKTDATLWQPPAYTAGKKATLTKSVDANAEASVDLSTGAAAIQTLTLKLATADKNNYETAWRSVILKIDFDGHQTVWCPIGDFAGSGYGGKMIKSWYRELLEDGTATTRWVMPYQKKARITIINKNNFNVNIDLSANVGAWKWDDQSMYFHATYKYEQNVKDAKWDYDVTKVAKEDTAAPIEWNFTTIKGKGIYLGNTLSVLNHMNSWYGEGDAKVWVDNETFPSEFGTGLEDYYNTSWAPVVLYQTPFANAPRADSVSSFGHNTFTRTRILDGIPFNKNFSYNLEMLSWDGGLIDCAATVYWYGSADAKDNSANH